MKLSTAARQVLDFRSRPQARGAPVSAANSNSTEPVPSGGPISGRRAGLFHRLPTLRSVNAGLLEKLREEADHGGLFLLAPLLVGAGVAAWFLSPAPPSGTEIAIATCLALPVALLLGHWQRLAARILLAAVLVFTGAGLAAIQTARLETVILEHPVTTHITARVTSREAAGPGRWRYGIRILNTRQPKLTREPTFVMLTARTEEGLPIGSVISGPVHLSPPSGPAMPGLTDFAFPAYFAGQGANGYFLGAPRAVAGPFPRSDIGLMDRIAETFSSWRSAIGDRIRARIGGDEGALAAALITNEQRAISAATVENLRRSGLAHIIAISGMNMVLAAGVFFVGLRSLLSLSVGFSQALSLKKVAAMGAALATAAYYLVSGFALSAERAFIMMLVALAAVLIGRSGISLRTLALSALIVLVKNPESLLSPSFQLSFSGTLGLVAAFEAWARRGALPRPRSRHPVIVGARALAGGTVGIVATALIGGLSTALFSVAHFQRMPLFGFAANMMVAPLIDFLVMPMALLAMLLMPAGLDYMPLQVMGAGLRAVMGIGAMVAGWESERQMLPLPAWCFIVATAGFLLLCLLKTRLRLLGLPLLAVAGLGYATTSPPRLPDILIAEDGEVAGIVAGGQIALTTKGGSSFVTDQWQRALGLEKGAAPVGVKPAEGGRADAARDRYRPLTDEEEIAERAFMAEVLDALRDGTFACKAGAWCLGSRNGTRIAVLRNGIYAGLACDMADVVVSRTGKGFPTCRSGALLVSRDTLQRTGSLALYLTRDPQRPEIVASFQDLDRPWMIHRAHDWRTGEFRTDLPAPIADLIAPQEKPASGDTVPQTLLPSDSGE
ncbi:ComEC/Rec2 family competence protein [Gellertiella hungarica]|uniref:ComEC/Rec2-related protein n=1 Tax=Gellertiella hungarica TaxID=1572859 RepID=A0A7W6NL31_9HYPH|nr:ComEC/Rec2 family competence protein [Gellertiella hungarica]MBB4064912.1 ComEC/Rec2-related protein [Gellertiella hungarica]